MKKTLYFTLLFISLHCLGQQTSQKWSNVNYAGDGQGYHNLDIYLPSVVKDKYPVVIYIYGSAWYSNNGKGADMTTVGAALLDAGFAVVTPNHRSSSDAKFPAQIHDIKAVIRFVRGTSAQYKFDTSFVAISGSSSGGHLASLAGTTNGVINYTIGSSTMNIEGTLGSYTNQSSDVDAVVDFFGPIDFHRMEGCNTYKSGGSPEADILGVDIGQNLDKAALLGPINYVDPTDPPFLIFHGQQDNVVPYCQSEFLYEKLQNAGVQSELVLVPNGQHGPGVNNVQQNLQKTVEFLTGLLSPTEPIEQLPFNEHPHPIPGRIEAEEYDLGGEGLGYHEANTNGNESGATFRNDQVDIEETSDIDGNYNIGYILSGEWLEYTVEVSQSSTYSLDLRVATQQDNKTMHVEIDGNDVTGIINIPNTGGWQTWQTITVSDIEISSGSHQVRLVFDADYFNLNYIEFKDIITSNKTDIDENVFIYNSNKELILKTNNNIQYHIYSISGKLLSNGKCNDSCTLDPTLPVGLYLISYELEGKKKVKRFMKF